MCITKILLWQAQREDVGCECRINRENFSIELNEKPEESKDVNTRTIKQISDASDF